MDEALKNLERWLKISVSDIILYIIYTILLCNILDVIYTQHLLSIGYKELNPIADILITNTGYTGLLVFKSIPIMYLYIHREEIDSKYIPVLYFLALLFVTLNYYQLERIL